jgi:hypothetical protein
MFRHINIRNRLAIGADKRRPAIYARRDRIVERYSCSTSAPPPSAHRASMFDNPTSANTVATDETGDRTPYRRDRMVTVGANAMPDPGHSVRFRHSIGDHPVGWKEGVRNADGQRNVRRRSADHGRGVHILLLIWPVWFRRIAGEPIRDKITSGPIQPVRATPVPAGFIPTGDDC